MRGLNQYYYITISEYYDWTSRDLFMEHHVHIAHMNRSFNSYCFPVMILLAMLR